MAGHVRIWNTIISLQDIPPAGVVPAKEKPNTLVSAYMRAGIQPAEVFDSRPSEARKHPLLLQEHTMRHAALVRTPESLGEARDQTTAVLQTSATNL